MFFYFELKICNGIFEEYFDLKEIFELEYLLEIFKKTLFLLNSIFRLKNWIFWFIN